MSKTESIYKMKLFIFYHNLLNFLDHSSSLDFDHIMMQLPFEHIYNYSYYIISPSLAGRRIEILTGYTYLCILHRISCIEETENKCSVNK
jgi:hypothetical protein